MKKFQMSDALRSELTEYKSEKSVATMLSHEEAGGKSPVTYIDFSTDFQNNGKLSYMADNKFPYIRELLPITDEEIIERIYDFDLRKKHATSISAGKLIHKLFALPAAQCEKFNSIIMELMNRRGSNLPKGAYFQMLKGGVKVKQVYNYNYYAKETGSLGNSCMRYDGTQKYLDYYGDDNKDKVNVLVLFDKNHKVLARSLIWKNVKFLSPEVPVSQTHFMDRIYVTSDEFVPIFKAYAASKGWVNKAQQDGTSPMEFEYKGNRFETEAEVQLNRTAFPYYPYFDTFGYASIPLKKHYNYDAPDRNLYLKKTDGTYSELRKVVDGISISDLVFGQSLDDVYESKECTRASFYGNDYVLISETVKGIANGSDTLLKHKDCWYSRYSDKYYHNSVPYEVICDGSFYPKVGVVTIKYKLGEEEKSVKLPQSVMGKTLIAREWFMTVPDGFSASCPDFIPQKYINKSGDIYPETLKKIELEEKIELSKEMCDIIKNAVNIYRIENPETSEEA